MGSIQYLKIQPIPVSLSYLRYIFRHFYKVNVSEVSTDIEEISWTMRRNCMNHATLAAAYVLFNELDYPDCPVRSSSS